MKKIGILFGIENSFPSALAEEINARNIAGVEAEFVQIGAVSLDKPSPYAVIVDRISHQIPFYRAALKHAALSGTIVLNNPFWASADDKFVNYTLAAQLGVAVPPTVILPHKQLPGETTERSLRNLEFPLDWEAVFSYVGEHGFLKPIDGGGWRDVYEVHSREEFFNAYDETRDLCMVFQKAVDYTEYFRCYVVGGKQVHVMRYDPRRPHPERYVHDGAPVSKKLLKRIEKDAIKLCSALGYAMNTVEFAVEKEIPYAIDFMNPVPDADIHSVGQENFDWFVKAVADLAIARAKDAPKAAALQVSTLLEATSTRKKSTKTSSAKTVKPARKKARTE